MVTEKQRHEIDSERRKEKHRVRVISEGGKDSIRYALRWGNAQGITKDTPFATFNEHRGDHGITRTLLRSTCESVGGMNVVSSINAETNGWPHGQTNRYAFCGTRSLHGRYRHILEQNRNGFNEPKHISKMKHLCMAHIGEYVHEKAEIRVLVGFVRAGGEPEEPNFSHDWSDTYTNEGKRFEYHWLFIRVNEWIPEYVGRPYWQHICIDIERLIKANPKLAELVHPEFEDWVYLNRMYLAKDWGYIDQIEMGVAEPGYFVEQTEVAHRPNTKVTYIHIRNHHRTEMTFEYDTAECGVDIPEFEIIGEPGVQVEKTEVNIWDEFGNDIKATQYSLTDAQNRNIILEVSEAVKLSPGVTGLVQFGYRGIYSPIIDLDTPALADFVTEELQRMHTDLQTAIVSIGGDCNDGWYFDINWDVQGDYDMVEMETFNLTGVNLEIKSDAYRSGGIYVREIPGGQMATTHSVPQVQVKHRDILAQCNTADCSFNFWINGVVNGLTPTTFQDLSPDTRLTINGNKLKSTHLVTIGGMPCIFEHDENCQILSTTASEVVVSFSQLPWGNLRVKVFTSFGLMRAKTPDVEAITVEAQPVTINPQSGTHHGGTVVTLSGIGVGLGDQEISVGGQLVEVVSRYPNEVVIKAPPMTTNSVVDVTLGSEIPITISEFSYDQNSEITFTASKTTFSVKGEPDVRFTFSQSLTGTITMLIDDIVFEDYDLENSKTFKMDVPPHEPGYDRKLKFFIPGHGFTNSVNVRYRLTIASVTPSSSSTAGGQFKTFKGNF